MFGTYFYHETIKRCVSVFGTLFNNLDYKKTKEDGTVLGRYKVPISYGPAQKYLQRLAEEPNLNDGSRSAISLPRMAFELTGFTYDAQRQQNKLIRTRKSTIETDNVNRKNQYAPAPYDLNFTLSIMAKNMNDVLQLVEQILPYFQPEYTVTMKMVDDMSDNRDVPIVLNDVSFTDDYEGEMEGRRVITYDLSFTMKTYFFGPIGTSKLITKVIERSYIGDGNAAFSSSQIDSSGLVKEVKHYEPAFSAVCNAVSNSATVTFDTAINSGISTGDEVVGTGNTTNPTVSAIAENRLSITLSAAATITGETTLFFVGSVDPNDTYVVSEEVTFYDDGTSRDFTADKTTDAS